MAAFRILALMAAAFLAGCASGPLDLFQSKGQQALASGVKNYEDGDYKESVKNLQSALDLGLSAKPDEVRAHKYLAFIHCISSREKQCREEFKKALEIDPAFDLDPAEAGHPVWGPLFRNVKGKAQK